jgi:hypothetical protein
MAEHDEAATFVIARNPEEKATSTSTPRTTNE